MNLNQIEADLIRVRNERRAAGEINEPVVPPTAPESWSWKHIATTATGDTIAVVVAPPFDGGCAACHRHHDGARGYVEIEYEDPQFGKTSAVSECPRCRVLRLRVERINEGRLPAKFFGKAYDWQAVVVDGAADPREPLFDWVDTVGRFLDGSEPTKPPSIALLGPTGRGKSHAAFLLLRRALGLDVPVRWVQWAKMLDDVMSKKRPQARAFGDNLVEPGIVVVDDLGVGSHSGWARDIGCAMLEQIPARTVCVFTSNGVPNDQGSQGLDSMIGARAASRLAGICGRGAAFFEFQGTDWRRAAE